MDDEEIRKHKEKWRSWNEQREREEIRKKMNVQQGMENYAANLIQKISDPLGKNSDKQAKQLSKKMGNEIQSNICSICLELMIPPEHQPVILFPCGHNLCKDCLFERPPQGPIKKGLKLKLQKCSLCRQKIESYALNQSLMALICTYTNNKQLLEKEEQRISNLQEQEGSSQNIEQLRIRCKILQKQQKSLIKDSQKYGNQKQILQQVIQTLKKQKRQNQKDLQKLQQQGKLIAKCLTEKVQQMQMLQKKLRQINDKQRILSKALQPLKQQKQKQELLQFARIIQKK